MRVVLDVNVWISALLWRGVPGEIVDLVENQQITIFASQILLAELETTLRRAKLQPKIQSLGVTVEHLLTVARQLLQLCPTISVDVPQLRDQDDTNILAAAVAANAQVIVTGDRDLLTLNEFEGILIITLVIFQLHSSLCNIVILNYSQILYFLFKWDCYIALHRPTVNF